MANSKFGGGDGSVSNPFLVEDGYDLNAIRNNLTASYKLVKNIDLTQVCNESDGTGWTPIPAFRGGLDGNGYVIRNMFINRVATNQALFHSTRGGAITNLGLFNFNVIGGATYAAGIVGQMTTQECLVENCFATGKISAIGDIGGIAGRIDGGKVINSYSEVDITCTGNNIGGITSVLNNTYALIKNCFYGGTISGGGSGRGGVVGVINTGTVVESYYDSTKNSLGGTTAKTKAEMETPATFDKWTDQFYNFEKKVWVLRQGSYPRLFFTEATKYFIFVNNVYKTYRNQQWIDVSVTFPTATIFDQHGISDNDLAMIPRFKWNELREFGKFELVASADKFVIERKTIKKDMIVDTQIADAVVLKTTIDFSQFGDSINRIRVLQ
jgi:hypothetical protein